MLGGCFTAQLSFRRQKQDWPRWDPHSGYQRLVPNPITGPNVTPPTRQPCSFAKARCAQHISPEAPVPEPWSPVPYLVPAGCISLCCSRCPACRTRRPAAVWRKQVTTSQHPTLRFWSLCPSCLTRQCLPRGKHCLAAARTLSIHRFPTRDVQIKHEKEGISSLNPEQMLLFKPQGSSA